MNSKWKTYGILLSILLTGTAALASKQKNCSLKKVDLRPLPKHALTPEQQTHWEPELRDLFLNHPFTSVVRNPREEGKPAYIVGFRGTGIRAVFKKVALQDILEYNGTTVDRGLRGGIATESDYVVSKRLGCYCFPFVVRRYVSDSDPLMQQIPDLQSGMYVMSYFIENALSYDEPNYQSLAGKDPLFGDGRNRIPSVVRLFLFESLVGEPNGLDPVYDPITKTWIGVDGTESFSRHWTEIPHLLAMTKPNDHHYLNDRPYFDHLATLDADTVFKGLEEMRGLPDRFSLNYLAAKQRLIELQKFVRATQAKLGVTPLTGKHGDI